MTNQKIKVKGPEIVFFSQKKEGFISLTYIARHKDSERTNYIIQNWMRNQSTFEFIGLWEQINNPNFKGIEFGAFKNEGMDGLRLRFIKNVNPGSTNSTSCSDC